MAKKKTPEEFVKQRSDHKKYAKGSKPSMHRRCDIHDYKDKATYMFTICLNERRHLFGKLVIPHGFSASFDNRKAGHEVLPTSPVGHQTFVEKREELPYIQLSAVGEMIKSQWEEIPLEYSQIDNVALQIMPDHIHGMLQVRAQLPMPIGKIIGRFKFLTTRKYNQLINGPDFKERGCSVLQLWENGFADSIVTSDERRKTLLHYIYDNPRRLAIKLLSQDFFHVKQAEIAGYSFHYVGNFNLLNGRLIQLQCSRRMGESDIEKEITKCVVQAMQGAVFVTPCISAGEKAVTRNLFDSGFPLIVLLENGFSEFYKPPAAYLEACAMGKILFLAPWAHHNEKRPITREQCLALNQMAADICRLCGLHS